MGGMPGADQMGSDPAAILRETERKTGTHKKTVIAHPVSDVDPKNGAAGISSKPFSEDPAQLRRRTERDLKNPEFGIP